MAVQDEGCDDDAQNEVELGVTPEKSNEYRNGDRTRNRSQRNISPLPHDPREDEKLNQHGDRRDDAVNPQSSGNPFSSFESEKDGKNMADHRTQARNSNPEGRKT